MSLTLVDVVGIASVPLWLLGVFLREVGVWRRLGAWIGSLGGRR